MRKDWLMLIPKGQLFCHCCGLVITSRKHLTGDHWPIPRSKGGTEIRPAHYWCDQSHADRMYIRSDDLARLVKRWKENRVKFPIQVYDSINALKQKER